jgi:uncharacterized protein (TIGR03083 family)
MDFVDEIERESAALAEAARQPGVLAGAVPACPGWTGDDLVRHIGEVQAFWTAISRAGGAQPQDVPGREPIGQHVLDWYDDARTGLAKALREVPPDSRLWVWWNDGRSDTALEVARRQAHEAAVHRWDAQSVAGRTAPIPAELADDGVLEYCQRMLPSAQDWSGPAGVLALAATDTGTRWLIRLDPRPTLATDEAAEPLATVSGSASDLDLWLWRRDVTVRVSGDATVVAGFRQAAELD